MVAAVRLLYLGALAELGAMLTIVATAATVRSTVGRSNPASVPITGLHILANEILAPVAIVVWLLLASAISQRSDPARLGMAAFFGLISLTMLASLSASGPVYATADFTAGMVVWLISLVSMVLVFTPASNRYFRPAPELVSPAG